MDLKELISSEWEAYRKEHGRRDPKFAYVTIIFEDGKTEDATIALEKDMQLTDEEDDHVFYYCDGLDGLLALCDGSNDEFIVTGLNGYDNSIFQRMENIEFIRGLLEGIGDTTIDLSAYSTDGDYTIYLDEQGHVYRYWSCSVDEIVDLDEPGAYTDVEDDLAFIMYALQTEMIKFINHYKNLLR